MNEYQSAVRILTAVILHGRSLNHCFKQADSPLSRQICFGILRNYYCLNAIVAELLAKPLAKKHFDIYILLLAGIYSAQYLKRPVHSSINTVVDSVNQRKSWAKKLVNGVLRNYLRQQESIRAKVACQLEARTNHPTWLVEHILKAHPNSYDDIIAANNTHPPMTLRVNQTLINQQDYLSRLAEAGIPASAGTFCRTAITLNQPVSVDRLPGFYAGLASVQDEASQLTTEVMSLAPGQTVLDACAAPGGKTCTMLEACPQITLTALDQNLGKTSLIAENLSRLKLQAQVICADVLAFNPGEFYDRILLDAPCSASGVIRRHPDIKILRHQADIAKLVATQKKLLEKAWSLLKVGGELVYATCSIFPEENDALVTQFVQQHMSAVVLPIQASWGMATYAGQQILPSINGPDGFFYARLRKLPI